MNEHREPWIRLPLSSQDIGSIIFPGSMGLLLVFAGVISHFAPWK